MKESFLQYVYSLYKSIPSSVYEGLLSVLCLSLVTSLTIIDVKKGLQHIAKVVLVEYLFLLYSSTVFFRNVVEGRGYNFHPFWSYEAIGNGRTDLIAENVMNVVVFVPLGIILGSLLRIKGAWLIVLLTGLTISGSIEALQYYYHLGFSEVDDVIHNMVGCVIGYGVYKSIRL